MFYGTPGGLQPYYEWWAAGDKAEAWFGYSVRSAGDVDEDGYDDVIVGAYNYRVDKDLVGRAYVYLGEQSETPAANSYWRTPPRLYTGIFTVVDAGSGFLTKSFKEGNIDRKLCWRD